MGVKRIVTKTMIYSPIWMAMLILAVAGASSAAADNVIIKKSDIKKIYDAGYQYYWDGNWLSAYENLTFCYRSWSEYSSFLDNNIEFKEKLKEVIVYLTRHFQDYEPGSGGVDEYKPTMPSLPSMH